MDQIKFEVNLEREQIIGFAGVLLIVFGCFAPVVNVPIVGGVSYVGNGRGDGVFVAVFALAAAALLYLRLYRWVLLPATGIVGLFCYTLWRFFSISWEMQANLETKMQDNPFAGLAARVAESFSLGWGWVFLFLGVACLFASVGMLLMKQRAAMPEAVASPVPATAAAAVVSAAPAARSAGPMFKANAADARGAFRANEPRTTFGQRR